MKTLVHNETAIATSEAGQHRAEQLDTFETTLSAVRQISVIDVPLFLEGSEPVHDASRFFLQSQVHGEPALYITPSMHELSAAGAVSYVSRVSRSGQRSAHGVTMVDLMFDTGQIIPVALKPHQDDSNLAAVTEHLTNVAVSRLELENLTPFGILLGGEGKAYSMTHLEPELTTLDSVDWRYVLEHADSHGELLQLWSGVARQAALVHALGTSSHGDMAPRNIAMRPDNANVFFIDWEFARVSTAHPRDAEVRLNLSFKDLSCLLESMVRPTDDQFKAGIGLLSGTIEEQWTLFKHLVFSEYASVREEHAAPKDLIEVKDELKVLEARLFDHLRLVNHQLGREVTAT